MRKKEILDAVQRLDEVALYELAADEMESGAIVKGLWLKAQVASRDDPEKARLEYLNLRVQALKDERVVSEIYGEQVSGESYEIDTRTGGRIFRNKKYYEIDRIAWANREGVYEDEFMPAPILKK
ncbi:hypothetical protein [Limibacillus halophilus]|uniref:Uncharacterized protein n=1 Tax=Limibacillus halophilus TaxID=1579333 RepID=A0A839ST83_9PROT|nr:hypothetical protein [Limibacillus halophilus]MBB3066011.1 hypothetical protein [Limibacillus halophilus]